MDLETAITGILQREGSAFTDDAQDVATKYGVTLPALREYWANARISDLEALDETGARRFYRWRFQPFAGLQVDARVWVNILDAVTLHGPTGAVKAIQTAIGVKVDGQLGPKTAAAVHVTPAPAFCLAFADARTSICVEDVRRDIVRRYGTAALEQTDLKYLHGWIRRIIQVGFACLALLAAACGPQVVRLPAPVFERTPGVRLGINGSWHGPLDDVTIAHLCAQKVQTLRSAISDVDQAPAIVSQAAKCSTLAIVFLIEDDNLALARALSSWLVMMKPENVRAVELGNERNYVDTPAAFGMFVRQADAYFAAWNGEILSGGISDARPATLRWLRDAIRIGRWPRHVQIGIHRYAQGDGTPASPQDGWVNRFAETLAIKMMADGRDIAVTETGYVFDGLDGDETIAAQLRDDVAWFAQLAPDPPDPDRTQPVDVIVYQLVNRPTTEPIDHFGWLGPVGWRSAVDAFFIRGGR